MLRIKANTIPIITIRKISKHFTGHTSLELVVFVYFIRVFMTVEANAVCSR